MVKPSCSKYNVCKKLHSSYKNLWGLDYKDHFRAFKQIKKKKRVTSFSKILDIKQSFRLFYSNISEQSFKGSIMYSIKSKSKTLDKLVSFVESRLDSLLFRSCLVSSYHEAKLLVAHKHIIVNGTIIKKSGISLPKGSLIKLHKFLFKKVYFSNILKSRSLPNYIEVDFKNLAFIFMWDTDFKNTYYPIRLNYSKLIRFYK